MEVNQAVAVNQVLQEGALQNQAVSLEVEVNQAVAVNQVLQEGALRNQAVSLEVEATIAKRQQLEDC